MVIKESDYSFCSVVGRTDVGCRRAVNEDSIGKADTQNGLAVVICDGMGGNVGGKTASETAVNAILMHLRECRYSNPKEAVSNAIQEANRAVLKKAALRPELTGMGCTCVLLLIDKSGTVNIGHVGDSRIYLIRDGLANQLTKDQSYVQMLVDEGRLTPQEAEHHPRNNEITNAVGMMNMTPPVIREQAINPVAGDCFLLCSDGLSKLVPESDIVKIVSARSFSTDKRAEMLINAAKNNGGTDNISVQLVEFSVTPAEVKMAKDKKRMVIFTSSVVLAVVLLLIGFLVFRHSNIEVRTVDNVVAIDPLKPQVPSDGGVSEDTAIPELPGFVNTDQTDDGNTVSSNKVIHTPKQDSAIRKVPRDSQSVNKRNPTASGFCGNLEIFSAQADSLVIPHPKKKIGQKRKYSKACCNKNPNLYPNPDLFEHLEIYPTGDGGLVIKKDSGYNWSGYSVFINKVVINEIIKDLPESDWIKIEFE